MARNLATMVVETTKGYARPILLTVIPLEPPAHGRTGRLNRLIQRLARLEHISLLNAGRGLTRVDYNPDGIHPNDQGYRIIARDIAQTARL